MHPKKLLKIYTELGETKYSNINCSFNLKSSE